MSTKSQRMAELLVEAACILNESIESRKTEYDNAMNFLKDIKGIKIRRARGYMSYEKDLMVLVAYIEDKTETVNIKKAVKTFNSTKTNGKNGTLFVEISEMDENKQPSAYGIYLYSSKTF